MAHAFELLVQRSNFHEPGKVATGSDGDGDVWDQDIQDFVVFLIQPDPIDLFEFLPILNRPRPLRFSARESRPIRRFGIGTFSRVKKLASSAWGGSVTRL